MNNWHNRYAERVKLLVDILPTVAEEKRFALKGGTAINLFEQEPSSLGLAKKRRKAGWNDAYRAKVVFG